MKVFHKKSELTFYLVNIASQKSTKIGLVPTMGALHLGHLSLVKQAKKENDYAIATIFVNPTQFNNTEDLENYPKTLDQDLSLLESSHCDIVFVPSVNDIYTDNQTADQFDFDGLDSVMEGAFRDNHFDGVGTIISKFFNIIKPTNAYFGEKDFQQLQIIRKLVDKNGFNVNIVGCPIFREEDGLAMSSRNMRLTPKQRKAAPVIYETLSMVKEMIKQRSIDDVVNFAIQNINKNKELNVEYINIAEEDSLQLLSKKTDKSLRAFVAVFAGDIRLIDNIALY